MKTKHRNTGISISEEQFKKLLQLERDLGMSRNKIVGRMIDVAKVVSLPQIEVNLLVENEEVPA